MKSENDLNKENDKNMRRKTLKSYGPVTGWKKPNNEYFC